MILASKFLRFLSWLITNFFILIISIFIIIILFKFIKINIPYEYKILTFYLILNSLIWINFMIIPILTSGYTIGHYICKIKISSNDNKLIFFNIFSLSWHNSLFLFNFNSLIILVNSFPGVWQGFNYMAYFGYIAILTVSIINAFSFILDKKNKLTVNETVSKLKIITLQPKSIVIVQEKPISLFSKQSLLNKNFNKEIDKCLNSKK